MAIRDSLGAGTRKTIAQRYIADGYFEGFQFSDALGAYLQILAWTPMRTSVITPSTVPPFPRTDSSVSATA